MKNYHSKISQSLHALFLVLFIIFANFSFGEELDYFLDKANQGDADAQFSLGGMYELGKGAPQDYQQAINW